jgi:hypothetical protein
MPTERLLYLVNLLVGLILAVLMTQHWRLEVGGARLREWIMAAWVLTAADLLFFLRVGISDPLLRSAPTLMVTAGHLVLLHAARATAGQPVHPRLAVAIGTVHGLLLALFASAPPVASWRTVTNGLLWGALSLLAASELLRAAPLRARVMRVPAFVLAAQGMFHAVRSVLAWSALSKPTERSSDLVQLLGDLEVSFFMVALFVSVLAAYLREGNTALRSALEDVKQLAGLLPLCAWCHRIRTDAGTWQQLEQFLAEREVLVSHALCEQCATQHFTQTPAARTNPGLPGPPP